jgi:release factor glutamine methyltransferase
MDYTAQILYRTKKPDAGPKRKIEEIVKRLQRFEPIQYILGETEFFGLKLRVDPSVLIPRPETEELVDWVICSGMENKPLILDVGTGSGCIALALKKEIKNADVTALDISEKALETAQKNAEMNHLDIRFLQADMMQWKNKDWKRFDLIICNPPYIREKEKEAMFPNVLKYEPGNALFVPDADPLVFYRETALFAWQFLQKRGWLYFEINENLECEMADLMKETGFQNTQIKKDMNGKARMLRCRR